MFTLTGFDNFLLLQKCPHVFSPLKRVNLASLSSILGARRFACITRPEFSSHGLGDRK